MISYFDRVRKIPLWFHSVFAFLAFLAWGGRQWWQWKQDNFFSAVIFLKGLLLLSLVCVIYAAAGRRRPGFFVLGFFPLLWLALSKTQWDICAQTDYRYWTWLLLFVLSELFLFVLNDGRWILILISPLWIVLSMLFPFSILSFLSFGWVRNSYSFRKIEWARYGFPIIGLFVRILVKGRTSYHFFWYDVYEVLINDLYISFFFLGWLGALSFSTRKTAWFPAFGPLFLLPLGIFLLTNTDFYAPFQQEILKWILVFFAGFGLESFRRDMMDRSWHGWLLWFVLGFAFFGGVL
jgi:hypothetical protein